METHGFTNEAIPNADNTVRIDIVGGFALQKVTENRSYFRFVIVSKWFILLCVTSVFVTVSDKFVYKN